VDLAGMDLLMQLLEVARAHPELTTGGLLERWRQRPEHRHLLRLASSEMLTTPETAGQVLGDTLHEIVRREGWQRRTERLLEKARSEELSGAEKTELRKLLGRGAGTVPAES
jgi:DNA primase